MNSMNAVSDLRLPKLNPHGDAPKIELSESENEWVNAVAKKLPAKAIQKMAPKLWEDLPRCRTKSRRSDGQRGRWAEFRVKWVSRGIVKTQGAASLRPPALAKGLAQLSRANGYSEPELEFKSRANGYSESELEAACALLSVRRDPAAVNLLNRHATRAGSPAT